MIYIQHDIVGNYYKAGAAGEYRMQKDILLSEIAKIVATCPGCVVGLLNKSGHKTKEGLSNSKLVSAVSDALNKDPNFAKLLVKEILSGKKSADGASAPFDPKVANRLVKGTGITFGADGVGPETNKAVAEKELLDKTEAIRKIEGLSSNFGKYLVVGILIGGIGWGIYYCYKH